MPHSKSAWRVVAGLLLSLCALARAAQQPSVQPAALAQQPGASQQPAAQLPRPATVVITAVDENGVIIPAAHVTVTEPGGSPLQLWTDYAGQCRFTLQTNVPYNVHAEKGGFYQADLADIDPDSTAVRIVLAHEQFVKEEVSVNASPPGIDTQQVSDERIMNVAEIVNIPYQTSRDIRYLLPFYPGVVQDATNQVHVDGSETWETLDTLDGFDIRSPAEGTLDIRVSADAVRSIDEETTRYPVQYGRASAGVIAFYTGMGDNQYRFNATNFVPSFREINGIHFDKFVPRFTFSGPLVRDRAWWFDGLEVEYDNNYIPGLPLGADTNPLIRGSNLAKAQINIKSNILTTGLLFNDYHAPYEGLSTLMPQSSTTKRDIIAWLPYVRDQWAFHHGMLLDIGLGEMRYRDGYEPHGNLPFQITPETTMGSYFQALTGRSIRFEGTAELYLPPRHWAGEHNFQMGVDLDHINYNQDQTRAPVTYLNENGTPARISSFPQMPPFTIENDETGAYIEDRWRPVNGLLVEPGLRFDWDTIIRRPLLGPRLAAVYAPPHDKETTKISAGIGLYYDHTQLSYFAQPFAGIRYDTFYAADGTAGATQETVFTAQNSALHEPRAVDWSVGIERQLPWSFYGGANFLEKITSNLFTFANQSGPAPLSGNYALTNGRMDRYHHEEFDLRRLFSNGYTVYVAYVHSSARTNAALDYLPAPSPLGPQQPGPQPWNVPNRTISWGWLPFDVPKIQWFKKNWDFVYTLTWQSGFPYTAVNAVDQVAGAAGAYHFPNTVNFSPGLEWRFHFRGEYYGLRGVMENATGSANPAIVNNNIASPQFGVFTEPEGRALTARIRLIGAR